jgi:hypothetical protein
VGALATRDGRAGGRDREADRRHEQFLHSEELRRTVQALYLRLGGINTYGEHLRGLAQGDRAAQELLLHETQAMTVSGSKTQFGERRPGVKSVGVVVCLASREPFRPCKEPDGSY